MPIIRTKEICSNRLFLVWEWVKMSVMWYDDVFFNWNWVATRWQQYSTHIHTYNTQNDLTKWSRFPRYKRFMLRPLYPRGRNPRHQLNRRLAGTRSGQDVFQNSGSSIPFSSHYADRAIPTFSACGYRIVVNGRVWWIPYIFKCTLDFGTLTYIIYMCVIVCWRWPNCICTVMCSFYSFLEIFIAQTVYTVCTRINYKIVAVNSLNKYLHCGTSGNE